MELRSSMIAGRWGKPTLGFCDRMGGERLLEDRGVSNGAYGWRDLRMLLD